MKQVILTAILSLTITGCHIGEKTLSPEEVTAKLASLRMRVIPPKGTAKADVDAVFGIPKEIKELKGKGSKAHYPLHTYQLLPPQNKQNFRAFLYVTYRAGEVHYVGINHVCVKKGRTPHPQGSPRYLRQQEQIEVENVRVLADLIEIQKKYGNKLEDATWNKKGSEPAI